MDSLLAAVRCGAAAVYLGIDRFNARRAAHNFTSDTLKEAVDYCHAHGVNVHLALNTLIRDEEMTAALDVAKTACRLGVDALILQDVGLARCIRAAAPTMPLHASTQLSCHTPSGVDFLRDAGFNRVVLAREMNRDEIAACVNRGVEIEVFVHGALCMSVSGQCYFSAMLGGRSGNRGACAQPCRLPFGAKGKPTATEAALSLKDNCLVEHIRELTALGVTSLKIEGRMKRPEYVAAATTVYAAAVRGDTVSPTQLDALMRVFSRTGFTDGYYTAQRTAAMFGTRRKEDVTAADGVLGALARLYDKETPLVPITMHFTATHEACTITVSDTDGHTVTIPGDGADVAIHRPLDTERAEQQLRKTGGTPYTVTDITVTIGEGLTLPMARLNAMRREALDLLTAARVAVVPHPFNAASIPCAPTGKAAQTPTKVLRLASIEQYSDKLFPYTVFLPLNTPPSDIRRLVQQGQTVGIEIPRGMFGAQQTITAALADAAKAGVTIALCHTVGAIPLATAAGLTVIGGFGLNITNAHALTFYQEHGASAATLSMELTFPQMNALLATALPSGILVYGRQPLMLTRNCPRHIALGSCAGCTHQGLTDRLGTQFPVMCAGGCSDVLNSVPLYWGDRQREVPPSAFHLFHFTTETADEIIDVLTAYTKCTAAPPAITRGLYRRGVE